MLRVWKWMALACLAVTWDLYTFSCLDVTSIDTNYEKLNIHKT